MSTPFTKCLVGLLLAGLLLFAFQCGFYHVTCVDVGGHLRAGELLLSSGRIPSTNTFSFSHPDQPWPYHQWFPAMVYYMAYSVGGVAGLIAFKAALGAMIFLVVWASARREAGPDSLWPFWAVTGVLMLARVRFFERPDMFSAFMMALLVFCLRRFKGRAWTWIGLPSLMAIWANLHAGVIYGFVLVAVYALADWLVWLRPHVAMASKLRPQPPWRRKESLLLPSGLLLSLAAVIAAVWMINPSGPAVLLSPLAYSFDPFWRDLIVELRPPSGPDAWLLFGIIALVIVLQAMAWKRMDPAALLSFTVFALLATTAQRSILMFAVVATPYLGRLLESVLPLRRPLTCRLSALALPVAWLLLFFSVLLPDRSFRYGVGVYAPYYPVSLYRFIAASVPRQDLYNDMMYGGGILWFLYPDFRPFVDSRGEAYSREFWRDTYAPVSVGAPSWREIFRKYSLHGALVPGMGGRATSELAARLHEAPEWALVAFDDNHMVFLERTEANRDAIGRHEYRILWPGDTELSRLTASNAVPAIEEAARAAKLDPEGAFARTALARARMLGGDYAAAATVLSGLIHDGKAGGRHWREYGYCLYMAGRRIEAEGVFRSMSRRGVEPGFACYMLHFFAMEQGQTKEAERLLDKAVAFSPEEEIYRAARRNLRPVVPAGDRVTTNGALSPSPASR